MNKIDAHKVYSDSTLEGLTKKQLIGIIRDLEHNWRVEKESVERQYKILMEMQRNEM